MDNVLSLEQGMELFTRNGICADFYLRHHWPRFVKTREEIEHTRPLPAGSRVLDVGAHWLHQAAIYAHQGMQVVAMDLPATMSLPEVGSFAAAQGIALLSEDHLEQPTALRDTPDDHFDLVLFTEIIEHITFNPVAMWREIHRVTKPGGRIVVTTPNYYALRGRLWHPRRFFSRFGSGLEISEILNLHTHAHHWKEYSMRELIYCFCLLSPDFICIKASHLEEYATGYLGVPTNRVQTTLERLIRILRPGLHLEIEVHAKTHGIVIEPHW